MIEKKHLSKQLKHKRFDFFLVGMAVSLLVVFGAFSYTVYDKSGSSLGDVVIDEELIVMENTVQEKKKLPPPPPELEVVEDDEEIEEDNPEIVINDLDEDTEIITYDMDDDEPEETNEVFDVFAVSDPALFMGKKVEDELRKYLAENLVYPDAAREAEVQGVVVVQFVVEKNGSIGNISILTPPRGFGLESEAKRIIKSTNGLWTPAKQRTQPVRLRYQIPINFQLY